MIRDDDGFTPLYVAAICGHEQLLHDMLAFLKQVLPADKLRKELTDTHGFVHGALRDSIEFGDIATVRLILESVKRKLSQDALVDLLKSKLPEESDYHTVIGACCGGDLFETVSNIVVQGEEGRCKNDLIDLIFHDEESLASLVDKSTQVARFQEQNYSLKTPSEWTERLLQIDVRKGLEILLHHFIDKFNDDQLLELMHKITQVTYNAKPDNRVTSIWAHYINGVSGMTDEIEKLLERVSRVGREALKTLVLHDDGNGPITIQTTFWGNQELADAMLTYLPTNEKYEMGQSWWMENARQLIQERFLSSTSNEFWKKFHNITWNEALHFYLDHADDNQLEEFITAVTSSRTIEREQASIWGYYVNNSNLSRLKQVLEHGSERLLSGVKELLLHDDGNGAVIVRAVQSEERDKVAILIRFLSEEDKQGVLQFLQLRRASKTKLS